MSDNRGIRINSAYFEHFCHKMDPMVDWIARCNDIDVALMSARSVRLPGGRVRVLPVADSFGDHPAAPPDSASSTPITPSVEE